MPTPVRPDNHSYGNFNFYDTILQLAPEELARYAQEVVVRKNEIIYDPSSDHLYMYEILEGAIKLGSYTEEGEEFTFEVLHRGDFFGDLKYLNNQFFEFSKALVDTRIRVYHRDFFKRMVVATPKISEWFISYLVKRWCSAEKKLKKLHEKKPQEKLTFIGSYLDLQVRDMHGATFHLVNLLTQKDLGDLTGLTRQTVASTSRSMARVKHPVDKRGKLLQIP